MHVRINDLLPDLELWLDQCTLLSGLRVLLLTCHDLQVLMNQIRVVDERPSEQFLWLELDSILAQPVMQLEEHTQELRPGLLHGGQALLVVDQLLHPLFGLLYFFKRLFHQQLSELLGLHNILGRLHDFSNVCSISILDREVIFSFSQGLIFESDPLEVIIYCERDDAFVHVEHD